MNCAYDNFRRCLLQFAVSSRVRASQLGLTEGLRAEVLNVKKNLIKIAQICKVL
jgi:hypothetical protein